jgi:glycosyltransferase involved in cell wall biosynthesis
MYLRVKEMSTALIDRLISETPHDLIFLNSLFSPVTRKVLLLRKLSRKTFAPVIIAPRGECAPSALSQKSLRKAAFLAAAGTAGLYDDLDWLASSAHEAEHIRHMQERLKLEGPVHEIPELPVSSEPDLISTRPPKMAGHLSATFLGRISPVKNLVGALEALANISGEVTLSLYGPRSDPNYWAECERRIAELPANVTIRNCGPIPHEKVPAMLANQDVLISPSFGENYGHSIIEALSVGCPVLTSDQTPWLGLEEQGVGWDLPVEDLQGMRSAIQTLVDMDEPAHAAMRRRAIEYSRSMTDFAAVAEMNVGLFQSLARPRSSRTRRAAG